MRATVPYVEKRFNQFNKDIFAGELPMLPIELSNAKSFLGVCVFKVRRFPFGKTENYDFRLKINGRVDFPERELEDIIIHEMIHYYIGVKQIKDTSPHGKLFRTMMALINQRFGRNIRISHHLTHEQKEASYGTKRRWHVVAAVSFIDGRCGVKVLPRIASKIVHYYKAVTSVDMVTDVQLYISDDIYFNRYPTSAALKVIYVDREELFEHLHDAQKIEYERLVSGK